MDRQWGGRGRVAALGGRAVALVEAMGARHAWPVPRGGAVSAASMAVKATLIRPGGSGRQTATLREIWRFRELLYFLVWRDVKVRYKQTVLGIAWALIQPLMTMLVFTVFFGRLARMSSDGVAYPLFAFVALAPWTYVATAVTNGAVALVSSQHLISKVYFPRLLVPLASVLTPLMDLAITLVMLVLMLAWYAVPPNASMLLALPFIALGLLTALAVTLWLSALNVQFRDVRYVLPFLVQFWLFATPVAYPASLVPAHWRVLYGLNPMASVVEGMRHALLGTPPPGGMVPVSIAVTFVALAGGFWYFRRVEGTLVDVL
jgi:lipopolysaccharide transport system permease protein